MPVARARHASVTICDKYVFLFGGVTVAPPFNTVPAPIEEVGSATRDASEPWREEVPDLVLVSTIDRYDVERDEWSTAGQALYPRQMSSVAVVSPISGTEDPTRTTGKIHTQIPSSSAVQK